MHFTAYDACPDLSKVTAATPAPVSDGLAAVIAVLSLFWILAAVGAGASWAVIAGWL